MLLVIVAARILHDKAFGEFSFALAIASIFETGIELGISTLVVRSISRDRQLARLYLPNVLGWKLILSVISMSLMVVVVHLLHQSQEAKVAAYIMGGAIVLRSYKGTTHAFFQAYERFDLILLTTYIERISVLVVAVGVLWSTHRLIPFVAAFAIVRIPDLLIALYLVHKHITPIRLMLPSMKIVKEIQLKALPFGIASVVGGCYSYIGTVILSAMKTSEHVGWYSASYKVYEGLTMFPYLICAVFLPKLCMLYASNKEKHKMVSLQWIRFLILASVPVILIADLFAPQVILLFYGKGFLPAIGMLRILLVAAILMFINWSLTTVLNSADGEKLVLKVTFLGLIVMSAANLILIQKFGDRGAAYSVVVSETFAFTMYCLAVRKRLFHIPFFALAWRPAVASVCAAAVLYALRVTMPVLIALIFTSVYGGILLALRTFNSEDVNAFKNLFPKRSADNVGESFHALPKDV